MAQTGRPSIYTPELAAKICERLAAGESLRSIARDPEMPAAITVRQWVTEDRQGFAAHYARARDAGLDHVAEEVFEIADNGENDWMERNKPGESGYEFNGEHVQRSRLRFDARRWYLSKLAPKRYGDRITTELVGADGGPVKIEDAERTDKLDQLLRAVSSRAVPDDGSDLV